MSFRAMAAAPLILALGGASGASAQSAAEFYKGKTVTITVPFDAGGTYSHYALLTADYLSKHIPGNPNMIVQHMPGAGGIRATNFVFNAAARDGTVLLMPPDTMAVSEIVQPDGIKYKSDQFTWIGTVVQTNAVVAVRADAGVKTVDDLKKKEVAMASTGKGSQTFLVPSMMNGVMGTKMKIVMGYAGSARSLLSMEQNETQGVSLTWGAWKLQRAKWFQDGFAVPVMQLGLYKEPDLPNVPMAQDLVRDPDGKRIIAIVSSMSPLGRGLVAPPEMPQDRVAAMRAAFDRTVKDPGFLEEAKKRNLDVNPLGGIELQKIMVETLKVSPEFADKARKAIMGEG
jgi:tripartite-type tricarboxylate transporter receptor subunit TctC